MEGGGAGRGFYEHAMISPNDPTPFPATDLHLFHIKDGSDSWHYIARDNARALSLWLGDFDCETMAEYFGNEPCPILCKVLPDETLISIRDYDEPESGNETTLTCREWCAEWGEEGMLCTNVDF